MKLASELQKRSNGRSIYVLDEPTTGLHFEDIRKLLLVLQGLVDKGNSVIVIEHNLDVIKSADWLIDMGPEGGFRGGTVVAEGPPEFVATVPESHTGRYLAKILDPDAVAAAAARRSGRARRPADSRRCTAVRRPQPQRGTGACADDLGLGLGVVHAPAGCPTRGSRPGRPGTPGRRAARRRRRPGSSARRTGTAAPTVIPRFRWWASIRS